jgi:predicted metal-dependent hydrolase
MKRSVTTHYRGTTVTVFFKPISSIRIKLARTGTIELSLPLCYSVEEGLSFLDSKKKWIEHHLEKIRHTQALSPSDLSRIPYWGKSYPTNIIFDEKTKMLDRSSKNVIFSAPCFPFFGRQSPTNW